MRYQILSVATTALLLASTNLATAQTPASDVRVSGKNIKAPKASVVAIMDDAKQALLWDGKRDEYVVVRKGDRFHNYKVTAVDREQVVLTLIGSNQHFVLPRTSDTSDLAKNRRPAASSAGSTGPDRGRDLLDPYAAGNRRRRSKRSSVSKSPYASGSLTTVKAPRKAQAPLDPYGGRPTTTVSARKRNPAPLNPYAGTARNKTSATSAPLNPYASSGSTSAPLNPYAKTSTSGSTSAPLDPYASASSGIGSAPLDPYGSAKKKKRKGKTRKENRKISRREFDAAVTDFHALSKEVQFAIISKGVQIKGISRGSVFYRWGFRDRDIILNVDGKPIRGVDDAAAVYAHLMGAKRFKVKVLRDVDTVILNYRFKK